MVTKRVVYGEGLVGRREPAGRGRSKPAKPVHRGRRKSKGNSVVLHELYFDGLTPKAPSPQANVRAAIEKRFGSVEKWADDFQASAKAAAGWALLVQHSVNGKLYNVVSDEHTHGVLWMARPLVVIDVYEHAFYVD